MAETQRIPTMNDYAGYRTVVYDTKAVPEHVWEAAQHVHEASLRALLPEDEQHRAATLVNANDFPAYRDTRVDPNLLVGNGWNDNQLFRRPTFAATFDPNNRLVGGVLTADNTSASRFPEPLQSLECWAKMLPRPGVPIPVIGNKRYLHLREVFTHPDLQETIQTADGPLLLPLSRIALVGIYHSLAAARPEQPLAAYVLPGDQADAELTTIVRALGLQETGQREPHTLPDYAPSRLVRVQSQVGEIMHRIVKIPGAHSAITTVQVSRVSGH